MRRLLIFGAIDVARIVEKCLIDKESTIIIGYIDNDYEKTKSKFNNRIVISPNDINKYEYDYIIIAVNKYLAVSYNNILEQLEMLNIDKSKIIEFYGNDIDRYKSISKILDISYMINEDISAKIEAQNVYLSNLEYELAGKIANNTMSFPNVSSEEETINKIVKDKASICRYGDGELALIFNDERCRFQNADKQLIDRLREILISNDEKILIGLSDFFDELDKFDESIKLNFRRFFYKVGRKNIYSVLDMSKQYYNSYTFRPYCFFKDKGRADKIFVNMKKIWNDRKVVIIEGEYTKLGVGNDLFSNARSIERIETLNKDAYQKYNEIMTEALKISKDKLILIALGPAATVLAYDLAKKGYQAIDIGHVDIEYEHYLRKQEKIIKIDNKFTNDYINSSMNEENNEKDSEYIKQIISRVL